MNSVVSAILCLLMAGALSNPIQTALKQNIEVFGLDHSLGHLLGSAKEAIGDELFLKADSYYHGGVKEKFKEKEGDHGKGGFIDEASHDHEIELKRDWIKRINDKVAAHQHYHLEGDKTKEMLPYFSLATTLNPHNVEAILTTAYWLERQYQKTDETLELLEKGVSNNPESWELENALASFYFRVKADMDKSSQHYLAAIQKSKGKPIEYFIRMDMNYYLAQALERLDRKEEALRYYQSALNQLSPENRNPIRDILLEKIKELSYNAT